MHSIFSSSRLVVQSQFTSVWPYFNIYLLGISSHGIMSENILMFVSCRLSAVNKYLYFSSTYIGETVVPIKKINEIISTSDYHKSIFAHIETKQ